MHRAGDRQEWLVQDDYYTRWIGFSRAEPSGDDVLVHFANREAIRADLVIRADGFR
jgi:hypothetical protein